MGNANAACETQFLCGDGDAQLLCGGEDFAPVARTDAAHGEASAPSAAVGPPTASSSMRGSRHYRKRNSIMCAKFTEKSLDPLSGSLVVSAAGVTKRGHIPDRTDNVNQDSLALT